MNAKIGVRGLVAAVAFASLPVTAFGHAIIPWGQYPSLGDVRIATKQKALLDKSFLGQMLEVAPPFVGAGDGVWAAELGSIGPSVGGELNFTNAKGTKAKLTVYPTAVDAWRDRVATLVQQYRESKGDTVTGVTVTLRSTAGTATFKTKPSPIGPYHKANVSVTVKFLVVVALEGGKTKSGTVTMTVAWKGVRLGFPGED